MAKTSKPNGDKGKEQRPGISDQKQDKSLKELLVQLDPEDRKKWRRRFIRLDAEEKKKKAEWDYQHRDFPGGSQEKFEKFRNRHSYPGKTDAPDIVDANPPRSSGFRRSMGGYFEHKEPRPLTARRRKTGYLPSGSDTDYPFRLQSPASGKRAQWDFRFETSERLQEFIRAQWIIGLNLKDGLTSTERTALLIDRYSDFLVGEKLSRKEIAGRFKIGLRRFRALVAKRETVFKILGPWIRLDRHIRTNRPIGFEDESGSMMVFLQETEEFFRHDPDGWYVPLPATADLKKKAILAQEKLDNHLDHDASSG